MFPVLLVLYSHTTCFPLLSTKDSAFTVENTEHGLEVRNSPVTHWLYEYLWTREIKCILLPLNYFCLYFIHLVYFNLISMP